jgi:hypothetical protein
MRDTKPCRDYRQRSRDRRKRNAEKYPCKAQPTPAIARATRWRFLIPCEGPLSSSMVHAEQCGIFISEPLPLFLCFYPNLKTAEIRNLATAHAACRSRSQGPSRLCGLGNQTGLSYPSTVSTVGSTNERKTSLISLICGGVSRLRRPSHHVKTEKKAAVR